MGPILATSVRGLAARASTSAARAGPSTSTTAVPITLGASRGHTCTARKDEPASDTTPNTPSAIFDRIRNTPLPSFDGLTSSSSLSSTLSALTDHTRNLASQLRSKLSNLSTQYNTHTGYTAIETLKSRITLLETSLESARTLASDAKKTYLQSVQSRSTSQRETNDLLSRKNSWTESDLSRYTELLRKEHALSRQETEAEKELERSEAEVQACFDELMKAVMVRYHEEQIWSDRMRGMSTYGSLLVAGLNAVLFVLAILLVEPYKRRRLAETFEQRLVAAEEQSRRLILDSVEGFRGELRSVTGGGELVDRQQGVEVDSPPLLPPPADEMETLPAAELDEAPTAIVKQRYERQQEERLVFASTVGVVMGAALSLLISACWS
ncbi:Sensitive to high expression protein 9, mitochondrial [Pseudozyma hubeiensis]|nr:Sensitive to high expression protein 9, mitochondrial [Pseudozyma hubeiensis]